MRKLRLELENIKVETFATVVDAQPRRGSVVALQDTADVYCYTADPRYAACTGQNPCTGYPHCTVITTCAVETQYCD
jgi:hypothetical protein